MSQGRARTRSARSGVERTNHEATIALTYLVKMTRKIVKLSPVHGEIELLNRQQKLHNSSRFFLGHDCHTLPLFETQQGMLFLFLLGGLKRRGLCTPSNLGNARFEICRYVFESSQEISLLLNVQLPQRR